MESMLKYASEIYAVCHIGAWFYNNAISEGKKFARAERKRVLRRHVLEAHPEHPSDCDELSCISI